LINVCIGPSSNPGPSGSTGCFRKNSHLGLLTLFLRITQILIRTEMSGGSCLIRRNRRIAVTKAILTELRRILKYVKHVRIVSTFDSWPDLRLAWNLCLFSVTLCLRNRGLNTSQGQGKRRRKRQINCEISLNMKSTTKILVFQCASS
jgi:hypothetical protein